MHTRYVAARMKDAILIIFIRGVQLKNTLRFVYFLLQRRTVINGNGGAHQ